MSRQKELFKPLYKNEVSLYACGLTVYEEPHIGNWSSYIAWDLLVRVLKDAGYIVNHVQNYTDVGHLVSDEDSGEDKLVKTARKKKQTAWEVADYYIKRAEIGIKQLNILRPNHMPRATQFIPQQIAFVEALEQKGFTYAIQDEGIYFDTSKLSDYGKLARLDTKGLKAGARVDDEGKRNPTDFALWKFSPSNEKRDMEWDSPWGKGFPGWHLECSVMSRELLGDTVDIHTGGIDHIPVHHTNEIAQTESVTGKEFVRYWLHRNFIKIEGKKLSKSLGNGYTLDQLAEKGFSPLDYRLLMLQSHYRNETNFSWDSLDAAKTRLNSFRNFANIRFQLGQQGITNQDLEIAKLQITNALHDDLNSPEALAQLNKLIDKAVLGIKADTFSDFIAWLDEIFGLDLSAGSDISETQKRLIHERSIAKDSKNYSEADRLRQKLLNQGILLRDTPQGTLWSRDYK